MVFGDLPFSTETYTKINFERKGNRYAAWFVDEHCQCDYAYSHLSFKPHIFPEWFRKITDSVMAKIIDKSAIKSSPNSCNVNYYDPCDSVGWHSDDEPLFESTEKDCLIISLSLGESRMFQIKSKSSENISKIQLNSGDLLTMEKRFQKFYKHCVPKDFGTQNRGPRINFTWRWITKHNNNCSLFNH